MAEQLSIEWPSDDTHHRADQIIHPRLLVSPGSRLWRWNLEGRLQNGLWDPSYSQQPVEDIIRSRLLN
jgi:hypothetical protein